MGIIRNPSKFTFKDNELNNLVAFKAISARFDDIKLAAKVLFPDEDIKEFDSMDGRGLFTVYMESKLSQLIKSLNKGDGSLQERITSLIILNNVYNQALSNEKVSKIDSDSIINQD
jgi:hypothetical protein